MSSFIDVNTNILSDVLVCSIAVYYINTSEIHRGIAHSWDMSWTREDKIRIHKRACNILFITINIPMTTFWTIFRRFPNTFRRFPKIFQKLSEGQTNVSQHCQKFPKISEKEPIMFRSYSSKSKGLCNHSNGNLFICENSMLFSRVKISCFRAKAHLLL